MLTSMRVGLRHDHLYLSHWHKRQKAKKEKKEDGEKAESAEEGEDVYYGRRVIPPTGWEEVSGQGCVGDDEPFEPHSYIDENGDDPDQGRVLTDLAEPEELRADPLQEL